MKPSELLKQKRDDILSLLANYPMLYNLRVFGSVARGDDVEGSDIDFLVDIEEGTTLFDLGGFQDRLQTMLGIDVDLLTPNDITEYFRDEVLEEAIEV